MTEKTIDEWKIEVEELKDKPQHFFAKNHKEEIYEIKIIGTVSSTLVSEKGKSYEMINPKVTMGDSIYLLDGEFKSSFPYKWKDAILSTGPIKIKSELDKKGYWRWNIV